MNLEEMRQRAREGIEPPPKTAKRSSAYDLKGDLLLLGLSKTQIEMMERVDRLSRDMSRGLIAIPAPRWGKSLTMKINEIAREMGVATATTCRAIEDMAKSFRMVDDQVDAFRLAMDSLHAVKGVDKPDSSPPKPVGPYWPHRIPVPASMATASNRGRKQRRPVNSFA